MLVLFTYLWRLIINPNTAQEDWVGLISNLRGLLARFHERISWGNMASSNLLKVGSTSIQLFPFIARFAACHLCGVMLAFSCNINQHHTAPVRDCAASFDLSCEPLSYIWLTLAAHQWFGLASEDSNNTATCEGGHGSSALPAIKHHYYLCTGQLHISCHVSVSGAGLCSWKHTLKAAKGCQEHLS